MTENYRIPQSPKDPIELSATDIEAAAMSLSIRTDVLAEVTSRLQEERPLLFLLLAASNSLQPREMQADYHHGFTSAWQLAESAVNKGLLTLDPEPAVALSPTPGMFSQEQADKAVDMYGRSEVIKQKGGIHGIVEDVIYADSLVYELGDANGELLQRGLKWGCRTVRQPLSFGQEFIKRGSFKYHDEHFNAAEPLDAERHNYIVTEAHLFGFLQGYSECLMALHRAEEKLSFDAEFDF